MNYSEAREYLKNVNKLGSILGLNTIKELLKRLGNPQNELKVVHIAGTNGKRFHYDFCSEYFNGIRI